MNQKILYKIAALCSRAERSEQYVKEKLSTWNVSPEESSEIIDYLIKNKYLDNLRFACAFARSKSLHSKWGQTKIACHLRAKQVSSEHISIALKQIDNETEDKILFDLLNKKAKTIKYKDLYDLKNKLLRFGISRGFSFSAINEAIEKLQKNASFTF